MVRRSMVLLLVLLASALLTPMSALAAKDGGSSFKAKVFVTGMADITNTTVTVMPATVSATFNCSSSGSLSSGSYFFQLANGQSFYGDVDLTSPTTCALSATSPFTGSASGDVTVENAPEDTRPGVLRTITLGFQNALAKHNFSPICGTPNGLCITLTLNFSILNPSPAPSTAYSFTGSSSATLLL